ncbi:unnamed protein product [Rotaria sp. Silwood2]|nr:unnamed protein product [Rotaria sp. Silwood2]CAF4853265.1 unnamed protein product [Rotaria sp. Silwood2]
MVALVSSTIFRQTYRTGIYLFNLSKQQLVSAVQTTPTTTIHGTITSLLTFNQQIFSIDEILFYDYPQKHFRSLHVTTEMLI